MLLAGDEFGQTQDGNNNVYCQDSEISWMKWDEIDTADQALTEFVRRAIALRRTQPLLHRESYRDGMVIRWVNPSGETQVEEQWQDGGARCIGLLLDGREIEDPAFERDEGERTLLIIFNSYHDAVTFTLPSNGGSSGWRRLLDTQDDADDTQETTHKSGEEIEIPGRSLLLLAASKES